MNDLMMDWLTTEFAAANAIIDSLCEHLVRIGGLGPRGYQAALEAIRRRRASWFPLIYMAGDRTIADVVAQLNRVPVTVDDRKEEHRVRVTTKGTVAEGGETDELKPKEERKEIDDHHHIANNNDDRSGEDIPTDQKQTTTVQDGRGAAAINAEYHSRAESASEENILILPEEGDSPSRTERINNCKRFVAKESVKGHMVNVVKGLKVHEDVLTDVELSRLDGFINALLVAGRRGELPGDTYILFNKQLKGNKREIIQLGVPMFQPTAQESTGNIDPIPPVLQDLINHLVQWGLITENKKPNSCTINFFDEDDHSQPYLKPPHLENPISTFVLHETKMAFGRILVSDQHGDFKGSLRLSLKKGSLLVMRGRSAEMARHVVRPSPKPRVSITFAKVRAISREQCVQPQRPVAATILAPTAVPIVASGLFAAAPCPWEMGMAQQQLQGPVLPTAPPQYNAMSAPTARTVGCRRSGTGVFLPWTLGPKSHARQVPPRIQKRRLPTVEMQMQIPSDQIVCDGSFLVDLRGALPSDSSRSRDGPQEERE